MPNKTIYVSEDDLPLLQRAQELTGANLSQAIATALRRLVEVEEGKDEGFEEVTVRVGSGAGRKQRFSGVLLGEWRHYGAEGDEVYRVFRTQRGKFAVHHEKSKGWKNLTPGAEKFESGWRALVGDWRGDQTWAVNPARATLEVADTLADLKGLLPAELYDSVVEAAGPADVEDLDI